MCWISSLNLLRDKLLCACTVKQVFFFFQDSHELLWTLWHMMNCCEVISSSDPTVPMLTQATSHDYRSCGSLCVDQLGTSYHNLKRMYGTCATKGVHSWNHTNRNSASASAVVSLKSCMLAMGSRAVLTWTVKVNVTSLLTCGCHFPYSGVGAAWLVSEHATACRRDRLGGC